MLGTLELLEVFCTSLRIYPLDERWSASPPVPGRHCTESPGQVEAVLIQVIRKVQRQA